MGVLRHTAYAARMALLAAAAVMAAPLSFAGAAPDKGEFKLARDYVLAACLIERYRGKEIEAEAQTWAGAMIEAGKLPVEAYAALAQLAKKAGPGSLEPNGVKLDLKPCFDWVHNPAFEGELKKTLASFRRR